MAAYFWVGGSGTWDGVAVLDWSSTSGGLPNQVTPPGSGDTVTFDANSGGGTVTVNTNFNVTSVTMGAFTGTLDFSANNNSPTMQTFSYTGTGTRTLNMGSGIWTITGNAAIVWAGGNTTNLTLNAGTATIKFTYSGSTGTRTIQNSVNTSASTNALCNIQVTAGSDTITMAVGTNSTWASIDFTGFTGTLGDVTGSGGTITGDLKYGTGMTVTTSTRTWTFSSTSTTQTITCNAVVTGNNVTKTGVGGTLTFGDKFITDSAKILTLTSGTLDANNKDVQVGIFASSNTNTRVLTMGSGTWTITGTGTLWTTATTNLTLNSGTSSVKFTDSSATSRTVTVGGNAGSLNNVFITAGSGSFTLSSTFVCSGSLDFTGFSGNWVSTTRNIGGSLIMSTGMTAATGAAITTLTSTSAGRVITSNGVQMNFPITLDGVAGSWQLSDALNMDGASARTLTLTNGTLDANNKNVTCGTLSSSNSNTRTLTMGSGTWTLTGTGTVWNITTGTGMTLNAGTSTILANNSSSSSKTFAFNAMTYYNLVLGGTGTGTFIIGVSTVTTNFNNISVTNPPHTIQVFAGKTLISAIAPVWSGIAGSLNTFQSTTNGVAWIISVPSGTVSEDYISLQDSTATGGALFYAGDHSTNVSGNTGWIFGNPIPNSEDAHRDGNGNKTLIVLSDSDDSTTINIYASLVDHALKMDDDTSGTTIVSNLAGHDKNHVPSLLLTSATDGTTTLPAYGDSVTHQLLAQST